MSSFKENYIEAEITEISTKPSANEDWNNFNLNPIFRWREQREQRRADWQAICTHILAGAIIIPFIVMVCYAFFRNTQLKDEIPVYFISLVSTVVGFYFAGRLSEKTKKNI